MRNLANNIRFFRKQFGYSQEKLARLINIDRSQISRYENDEDLPSLEIIETLANTFHTSIDELVGYKPSNLNSLTIQTNKLDDTQCLLLIYLIESISKILIDFDITRYLK